MLANILSRYWWMILLRGVASLAFGILVFAQPAISLVTLTLLFGAFALVDGISNTVSAVGGRRENENWGVLRLAGLAGIGIGVRSEERRVGKSVDLGGRRMIKQKK